MAEKRMFAKTIIDSDAFLDMPVTSQLLYFHLSMRADDDGFINKPKAVMRLIGASDDDLTILFLKKFVIPFESGVVVIKHWKINNYIRKDAYHETTYKEEKALLQEDENGAYKLLVTNPSQVCDESVTDLLQVCDKTVTQIRIDKSSIDKNSIDNNPYGLFVPHDLTSDTIYQLKIKEKNKSVSIYREDINYLQSLYPDVNVEQEIRNMVGWCDSNPTQRKTQSGIKAFITRWLNKEQNKVGRVPDQLRDETRKAYIKDVELKAKREKERGSIFLDT